MTDFDGKRSTCVRAASGPAGTVPWPSCKSVRARGTRGALRATRRAHPTLPSQADGSRVGVGRVPHTTGAFLPGTVFLTSGSGRLFTPRAHNQRAATPRSSSFSSQGSQSSCRRFRRSVRARSQPPLALARLRRHPQHKTRLLTDHFETPPPDFTFHIIGCVLVALFIQFRWELKAYGWIFALFSCLPLCVEARGSPPPFPLSRASKSLSPPPRAADCVDLHPARRWRWRRSCCSSE